VIRVEDLPDIAVGGRDPPKPLWRKSHPAGRAGLIGSFSGSRIAPLLRYEKLIRALFLRALVSAA